MINVCGSYVKFGIFAALDMAKFVKKVIEMIQCFAAYGNSIHPGVFGLSVDPFLPKVTLYWKFNGNIIHDQCKVFV